MIAIAELDRGVERGVDLGVVVDELGLLLAQKAELSKREECLKQLLKESGEKAVEGELFRATVSTFDAVRVDYKAICEKLEPNYQLVAAHTSTKSQTNVRVVAKNGKL
jgi:hypothetical protein